MARTHAHLAVVCDEQRRPTGVISLTDVLQLVTSC
jgi:CBS domain containing-hemolysin-like protein